MVKAFLFLWLLYFGYVRFGCGSQALGLSFCKHVSRLSYGNTKITINKQVKQNIKNKIKNNINKIV